VAQFRRLKKVSKIWFITRNDDSGTHCINLNSASEIGASTATMTAVRIASTGNSASEIRCINRNNDRYVLHQPK
jgi:ABC-type tungstate transport system permease subunit